LFWINYLAVCSEPNGLENRLDVPPENRQVFDKQSDFVKIMAISDHIFGCYKLQFRTAQDAKELTPMV
jgi:hypothetical protein